MKRELMTLAATVGLTLAATASPTGVYINDDFTGSSLNTAVWDASYTTGTVYVQNSYVNVQAANSTASLSSKTTLTPNSEAQFVKLTATNLGFSNAWPNDIQFGLSANPGPTSDEAFLRIAMAKENSVLASINGKTYKIQGLPGPISIAEFSIVWTPTKVQFWNGSTLWFDTSTTTPIQGGSWDIPDVEMKAFGLTYANAETVSADAIKYEVVPEPAMASLALLGAAAFGLRRRRD